jgi:hypothetical protein
MTQASVRPFRVDIPEDMDDLRRRIAATRWPRKELNERFWHLTVNWLPKVNEQLVGGREAISLARSSAALPGRRAWSSPTAATASPSSLPRSCWRR